MAKIYLYLCITSLVMFNLTTYGMNAITDYHTFEYHKRENDPDPGWKKSIVNPPSDENEWATYISTANNIGAKNSPINGIIVKKGSDNEWYAHDAKAYAECYASKSKLCEIARYLYVVRTVNQWPKEPLSFNCCIFGIFQYDDYDYKEEFKKIYHKSARSWPKSVMIQALRTGIIEALDGSLTEFTHHQYWPFLDGTVLPMESERLIEHMIDNQNI